MDERPALPAALKRDLLLEVGHRCAIPTCKTPGPLEFCHIVPRSKVNEDDFGNMIVLCRNCHFRFDHGEIDRKAMLQYKANLSVLNSRYGDTERRVLGYFALNDHREILLTGNHELDLMFLLRDGIVVQQKPFGTAIDSQGNMIVKLPISFDDPPEDRRRQMEIERKLEPNLKFDHAYYRLTDAGVTFIAKWLNAAELE